MRVTEILKTLGMIDDSWCDQHAMDRGTAVHAATAFDDEGDLDEASVTPEVRPYLEAYRKWRREMPLDIVARELRIENKPLDISGTLDGVFTPARIPMLRVVDIKTGAPAPWHRWQVALYRLLFSLKTGGGTPPGADLYLDSDGNYKWIEHNDRTDPDKARALIVAAHIVKECK